MRNHLIKALEEIAARDERVVVLTADLGYGVLDSFSRRFPSRCLNVGICEANMACLAAGLALEGYVVYTYSIGNFPLMRCLEQMRNSVCYHEANVKTIAVGGGFVYAQLGMSHHATEDLAISRALPNMKVFAPADPGDAVAALKVAHLTPGPCYIRLARGGEKYLRAPDEERDIMKIAELRPGSRVAVLATGPVAEEALSAADSLAQESVSLGVYNAIALKPFDKDGARTLAEKYEAIITLEEHNTIGGLYGALAETLFECNCGKFPRLAKLGLQDVYTSVVGSQKYLRRHYGLSAQDIVRKAKELLA